MSRYTFIGTISMPAQMGFKAPPPTHLYFERNEHIRTPRSNDLRSKGVRSTPMKGKGVEDTNVTDVQAYGRIADAASRFGSDLVAAAPELIESGTRHGFKIAKAVEDRRLARDQRLRDRGFSTKEESLAVRRDARVDRNINSLQRASDRVDRKLDLKENDTTRKDMIKQAKFENKLNRIRN